MNKQTKSRKPSSRKPPHAGIVMTASELAKLGGGRIAYIKVLSSDQARRMFPSIEELPDGIELYALQAADGTSIALTDTLQAALGHAVGDDLEVASVH